MLGKLIGFVYSYRVVCRAQYIRTLFVNDFHTTVVLCIQKRRRFFTREILQNQLFRTISLGLGVSGQIVSTL